MELKAKPKLDLVFKNIFGKEENKDVLIDFLSCVLDLYPSSIKSITILNSEILPESISKKFSCLDLKLQLNDNKIIDVEIQVNNYHDYCERSLYYWAKIFSNQLAVAENYKSLKDTVLISVVDFILFDAPKSHTTFGVYEKSLGFPLSDKLRMDFLELPKVDKFKPKDNKLTEWLKFLRATTEEELNIVKTNTKNPAIDKAICTVHKMSSDEKLLYEIQKREETLANERSALSVAKMMGHEIGLAEGHEIGLAEGHKIGLAEGHEIGLAEGLEAGRAEGLEAGRKEAQESLMAKLKAKGFSDEQIQDFLSDEK